MRSVLIGVYFLLMINPGKAQLADTARLIIEDGWIERMNNNLYAKLSFNNDYETFRVKTETNDIYLSPNVSTVARIDLNYRFLMVGIGFAPGFLPGNGDDDIKGKTKAINFGLGLIFRHWYNNIKYNRVNGYYLVNTSDYMDWEKGDPYIQIPDLMYSGISYTTGWRLNSRASLKSLTLQTERQLKSAGSFMPVFNFRYYVIDDRTTPSSGGATQKSNNIEWSFGMGYFYTFVLNEKFYTSLGFTPNLGYIHTQLTTRFPSGDATTNQNNLAFRWEGKGGIGYNGRDFFAGFYAMVSGLTNQQENTTAVNHDTRMFYQLFFGLRIKSPKCLNNSFDKLENMLLGIFHSHQ